MTDFVANGKVVVICDGQFGSTGKGLLAAYLAQHNEVDLATTNASANAGHTTCYANGTKFITFHLPTIGVVQGCQIYLNAGAIIDPEVLWREIKELGVQPSKVAIHPMAAVIMSDHKRAEGDDTSAQTRIGSTRKGVGEAMSDKVRRSGLVARDHPSLKELVRYIDVGAQLQSNRAVSLEIPQGFSLSINSSGFYPYCTSRDCTVAQGISDLGVHPSYLGKTAMAVRTFPIRVGNIFDEEGNQIGTSGPCYSDQTELTWGDIGVKPEVTTVTKRERRIFTWSRKQYLAALRANRPDIVFLNFVNYLKSREDLEDLTANMDKDDRTAKIHPEYLYGMGPNVEDVSDDYSVVDAFLKNKED